MLKLGTLSPRTPGNAIFVGSQDAPLEISVSWFKWRMQHWGSRGHFADVWEPDPLNSWIRALDAQQI